MPFRDLERWGTNNHNAIIYNSRYMAADYTFPGHCLEHVGV